MKRNPLVDPMPGDRVSTVKKTRIVTCRQVDDIWYYEKDGSGKDVSCCLATWKSWCKKNKVEVING